jgi:hypothetical protein
LVVTFFVGFLVGLPTGMYCMGRMIESAKEIRGKN